MIPNYIGEYLYRTNTLKPIRTVEGQFLKFMQDCNRVYPGFGRQAIAVNDCQCEEYDPNDDDSLSEVDRSQRHVTSLRLPQASRGEKGVTPTTTPPSAITSEVPVTPSSTMSPPPSDSNTPPFDTSTTTAPDTTPDPNDKCGTYFSAPRGMNDPSQTELTPPLLS
ncbi:unnamed protein product [Orchesella dallaii]|uniref:Uncharacterized protein n=1 Tax=Orchesella dallaii TaxID=48710 RepID=A0ABP1S0Y1_9HEXA